MIPLRKLAMLLHGHSIEQLSDTTRKFVEECQREGIGMESIISLIEHAKLYSMQSVHSLPDVLNGMLGWIINLKPECYDTATVVQKILAEFPVEIPEPIKALAEANPGAYIVVSPKTENRQQIQDKILTGFANGPIVNIERAIKSKTSKKTYGSNAAKFIPNK